MLMVSACSTRKVPDGDYLLVSNKFIYEDGKLFSNRVPDFVSQRPNRKQLFFLPIGLWFYNMADPKYDSILNEYMTYPRQLRTQRLRDSLAVKYGHPEYQGRNLFWSRFLHTVGEPPVILDQGATERSANSIRKFFVYKGYWDARVRGRNVTDSASRKATAEYLIKHNDPTYIKEYYYNIPDDNIRSLYESSLNKSLVRKGQILDQEVLENEARRVGELARDRGYFGFNASGEEIFFTADTLSSTKQVPLTFEFRRDSLANPYVISKFDSINVFVLDSARKVSGPKNFARLRGINFYNENGMYRNAALWRVITMREGTVYSQNDIDLTKRNIAAMNNFRVNSFDIRQVRDSLLETNIYLEPLPKYEFRAATDVHYSELLNLGFSPSVELTSRNILGGAENLSTGFSGIIGTTKNAKNPGRFFNAYELSGQVALNFPRLLLPFQYWQFIPKRYSPHSSIALSASIQNNIGLGRISLNSNLNYAANVRDIVSHRLSLFNTQVNFTKNKDKYYELFPRDRDYRNAMFNLYDPTLLTRVNAGELTSDEASRIVLNDTGFTQSLTGDRRNIFVNFQQSLLNKDRQTQDVLISSLIYNFQYNEIGNKNYSNPLYVNVKFESAGNLFSLFNGGTAKETGVLENPSNRSLFNIPYSQFVKFDVDFRKYFTFNRNTLAVRQFAGVGIPYGNSVTMPYVRSYFNGGSNDIRAWLAFGGLGPADSQLDEDIRAYIMDNVKLTTSVEYRFPLSRLFEGAVFTDAGNIWSLRNNGLNDEFRFNRFIKQLGVGSGFGLRLNIAYITLRLDMAYKMYDPNRPEGSRWVVDKIQPLKPTFNFAFGYPF